MTQQRSLPRRDWIVLPLIAAVTALFVLFSAEAASRVGWPEDKFDRCITGAEADRPKPNCSGRSKAAEGPWVEDHYNECGNRATGSCLAAPAGGAARIAVLGSSTSWGYLVPFDRVWSVQAARAITAACGRPIDVQGLVDLPSVGSFGDLNDHSLRLPEAMALHPQLVALVIAPLDLLDMPEGGFNPMRARPSSEPAPKVDLIEYSKSLMSGSRAVTVAQHYVYRNPQTYVSTYLRYGDRAGFMRPPLSQQWQERLAYLDAAIGYMAARLMPTGTRLLLVFAPQQAQAIIIADGMKIPGVDAETLNRAIAVIAARHGAIFADGALAFRGVKDATSYFYPADGHLNAAGHALLGRVAADAVLAARPAGLCQLQAR
jgi:hypothetical protein